MRSFARALLWQWHYWDAALSHLLTLHSTKPMRVPALVGAHLGDSWLWLLLSAGLWRWWRRSPTHSPRPFWGWMGSLIGGMVITLGVKQILRRPRPGESLLLHGPGADRYSFPSGHAVRWGIIAGWAGRFVPYGALWAWPLALWTGWSRVHLGIHYVGDVVVGYGLGSLLAWGVRRLLDEELD
jgi:membrane-associated phospholipid phosphatase